MPVKTFLVFTAIVTATIGLTLLVIPSFIADFFLPTTSPGAAVFVRYLGSTLVGYSYLNWFTAGHYDSLADMRPTLLANLSTLTIALVVSLYDVLAHHLKSTGYLIILLHATFAAGFAWYLLRGRGV